MMQAAAQGVGNDSVYASDLLETSLLRADVEVEEGGVQLAAEQEASPLVPAEALAEHPVRHAAWK